MSTQATATVTEVAGQRGGMVINGIHCDPTTAERVLTDPSGCDPENWRRFDEVLYRTPEGMWFVMRPLDPDEAHEWIRHVDTAEAEQRFPDFYP